MTGRKKLLRKFMVILMAFAVVFTYSVAPMSQTYAATKGKKPTKITLNVKKKTLKVGQKFTAKVKTVKPKKASKAVTWKSSNKKIATVSKKGVIKALKPGKVTITAVSKKSKKVKAKIKVTVKPGVKEKKPTIGEAKSRTMHVYIDMSKAEYDGKTVKVWVPVPQSDDFQKIENVKYSAGEITEEKENGNKMLYLEWGKDAEAADRVATLSYDATRVEVSRSKIKDDSRYTNSKEAKKYINKTSEYVKIDGIVKDTAAKIVKGKKGTTAKARAIYEWVIANLERIDNGEVLNGHEFKVDGCGYGDTKRILTDLKEVGRAGGHCTDINSTFVALCRAAGIPAREMFGIRMNDDATGGQHCWAEFYLPGTGWVYADPADVLKAIKTGKGMTEEEVKAAKASDLCKEKTEYFWGGVDNNRIVISRGRDITFSPAQAWGKCNTFGYPAAEIDGDRLPTFTDGSAFDYKITCTETGKADFVNMQAAEWAEYGITAEDVRTTDYIIDVRPDKQKKENGYVPGAVECPVSNPYTEDQQKAIKAEYDKAAGQRIVIVCVSGNMLAKNAMAALQAAGADMSNVTYLIGGFNNTWSKVFATVSADRKSVAVPAWVTKGDGPDGKLLMLKTDDALDPAKADLTHHVLVNENGGNAKAALLNTKTLPIHVYNALKEIGGTPCDKFNKADCFDENGKPVSVFLPDDAQKINVSFTAGDATYGMADFFDHVVTPTADITTADAVETETYVADMRFGGCMENITDMLDDPRGIASGNQTGCITCTFSCWIGTVSNGAYAYNTQEAKVNRANVPAADTPVTVVYTLGE